mmetsp:Transcript_13952/g.26043  ORF Transcript_13952/g.26043 Transcript_13952/m.26043 type:complete len:105 (-) Transcript_13952:126-440(-)
MAAWRRSLSWARPLQVAGRSFASCNCRALLGLTEGELKEEEVRRAFRSTARRLHPDRGGKREEFQELHTCYQSLLAEARDEKTGKRRAEWLEQMKKDFANFSCC